jgi:hypothetical protein
VANPGFEVGLGGWAAGAATTLARTCAIAHSGSCSAELRRTGSSGDAMVGDLPDTVTTTVASATYTATAWVRAPAGRSIRLRVRELSGGSVVRSAIATVTGNGDWRKLTVITAGAAGGTSLSVEILVSLTTGLRARADDVSLRRN